MRLGGAGCVGGVGRWEELFLYHAALQAAKSLSPPPSPTSMGGSVDRDKEYGLGHLGSESWPLTYEFW